MRRLTLFLQACLLPALVLLGGPCRGDGAEPDPTATLLTAAREGDLEGINRALAAGADVNANDADLKPPLALAIDWEHEAAALRLLDAGANVNAPVTKAGASALRYAVERQSLPLVKALLAKGANVRDRLRASPLTNALIGGSVPIVQLLLARGLDWRGSPDGTGATALQIASNRGNAELVAFLLAQGADPNERGQGGFPALAAAVWYGHLAIVDKLLAAGARVNDVLEAPYEVNGRVEDRITVLMVAAGQDQPEAVRALLRAKADPRALDSAALRVADEGGCRQVARLLREAGATYTPPASLPCPPGARLLTAINRGTAAGLLLPAAGDVPNALDDEFSPSRLAIIPAEAAGDEAALLTAALTGHSGLTLVERAEVDRVVAEHQLTQQLNSGGGDPGQLGKWLGADALLLLRPQTLEGRRVLEGRLVAVRSGLVLDTFYRELPLQQMEGWTAEIERRLRPYAGKLRLEPKQATALSLVNLRASVATQTGRELERSVTLLLSNRLAHEPRIFLLDRHGMDLLAWEKQLAGEAQAGFWGSVALLDGTVEVPLQPTDPIVLSLRLRSPTGGPATERRVAGNARDLPALVEKTARELVGLLSPAGVGNGPAPATDLQAEAARFQEEARESQRLGNDEAALEAAESAWALGARSRELALLRVDSRARRLKTAVWSLEANFLAEPDPASDTHDSADFFRAPLHHWQNPPDTPTGGWFCDEAIAVLDAYEEGVRGGQIFLADDTQGERGWWIEQVLTAATWPSFVLTTVSDQDRYADKLDTLNASIRRVCADAVKRWADCPADARAALRLYQKQAQCLCYWARSEEEFVDGIRALLARHFPTDDLKTRGEIRLTVLKSYLGNYALTGIGRHGWSPTYWRALLRALPPAQASPEDQPLLWALRYHVEDAIGAKTAAFRGFLAALGAMNEPFCADTRAVASYDEMFTRLLRDAWGRERLALFRPSDTSRAEREAISRRCFEYLCAHAAQLSDEAFELVRRAEPGTPAAGAVRAALETYSRRVEAGAIKPDQAQLEKLKDWSRRFGAVARTGPVQPTAGEPLTLTRFWEPFGLLPGSPETATFQPGGAGAMVWAEDKVWLPGTFRPEGLRSQQRSNYVFAVDPVKNTTQTILVPPQPDERPEDGLGAKERVLAVAPHFLFALDTHRDLGVYERNTRKWTFFPEVRPAGGYPPVVLGDDLYLVHASGQDSALMRFNAKTRKVEILGSNRRKPAVAPLDDSQYTFSYVARYPQGELGVRLEGPALGDAAHGTGPRFFLYDPPTDTWHPGTEPPHVNHEGANLARWGDRECFVTARDPRGSRAPKPPAASPGPSLYDFYPTNDAAASELSPGSQIGTVAFRFELPLAQQTRLRSIYKGETLSELTYAGRTAQTGVFICPAGWLLPIDGFWFVPAAEINAKVQTASGRP